VCRNLLSPGCMFPKLLPPFYYASLMKFGGDIKFIRKYYYAFHEQLSRKIYSSQAKKYMEHSLHPHLIYINFFYVYDIIEDQKRLQN
jgi:hypothetical protein